MTSPDVAADMAQFFDFGDELMPQDAPRIDDVDGLDDELLPDTFTGIIPVEAEFNSDFSTWLPGYQKPAQPCEYCRIRSLNCFIYTVDPSVPTSCSSCTNLFRTCSFTNPEKMAALKQKTALDTLDVVAENDCRTFGGLTGKKQMRSTGHVGPIEDNDQGEGPKKGAAASRFPKSAVKILKDWMQAHIDNPYPTEEEKEWLTERTGLNVGQISNWMANTRRRQKARPKRSASPSIRPSTVPINIPAGQTWATMGPLDRWKISPPENEPAPLTAIAQAIDTFDPPATTGMNTGHLKGNSDGSTGSFSVFKAPSISSLETGFTNKSSGSLGSLNSAYSYGSRHSLGSLNSLKAKERRRRRRIPARAPKKDSTESERLFQCTFCTDRFKSKYDWSRHEKSLHLSLEKWICAPLGEIITDAATGDTKCVYCDTLNPSTEHLATHNHRGCEEKGIESRTFYRKDHLRQHLRLMHGCKMIPSMESWKSEAQYIKSRCGFCKMTFTKWQDRVDHLAKEFRNGANMKDWKGCRGLDAYVAIHVTNAMPPYLIAGESKSPFPFSASNSASIKQLNMQLELKDIEYLLRTSKEDLAREALMPDCHENNALGMLEPTLGKPYNEIEIPILNPNATCWEILTVMLGRFAREYIDKHGSSSLTDDMLQKEARRILYGDPDDVWNQTSADNPEWLSLFKKAHGIDNQNRITDIAAQLDLYDDLGLTPQSLMERGININDFDVLDMTTDDPNLYEAFECSLTGTTKVSDYARRVKSGQRSPSSLHSTHSLPALSGSISTSPTSPVAFAHSTQQLMDGIDGMNGVYETMPEIPSVASGIATLNSSQRAKPVFECPTVGLRSFSPLTGQACAGTGQLANSKSTVGLQSFPPVTSQASMGNRNSFMSMPTTTAAAQFGNTTGSDFQFSSLDQLSAAFQFPVTSAEYQAALPHALGLSLLSTEGTPNGTATSQSWDDTEMNFAMDMDMDLDMDLNMLGKC